MSGNHIYHDIATRTGGDIYIGVVGPVRTGKSTLIRRFMDHMVVPAMQDDFERERLVDELPQSGDGRTVMTTQMQFVPSEAVTVKLPDATMCSLRLVDCVGYAVEGALGMTEEGKPRLVRTPWFEEEVPFAVAAEVGTRKVITDHSTLGIVVTTDGSITDLPRQAYVASEERVVQELQALGKPFVVVLNTTSPNSSDTLALQQQLNERYNVPVLALDVLALESTGITQILQALLYEFPARQMQITLPAWMRELPSDHAIRAAVRDTLRQNGEAFCHLRDHKVLSEAFAREPGFTGLNITAIRPETGTVEASLQVDSTLFYAVLSQVSGCTIEDEADLMRLMGPMVEAKTAYDRMRGALEQVRTTGYGLIAPQNEDLTLEAPQLVKKGGQYGVRLRASAPSWHLLRVDIDTEVSPTVGTEQQGEEWLNEMLQGFQNDPESIWQTDIFGRSLHELVHEGLSRKLARVPEEARDKVRETLSYVVNDTGKGGMVCILL